MVVDEILVLAPSLQVHSFFLFSFFTFSTFKNLDSKHSLISGRQLYNREYKYQQRRRFDSQQAVGGRRVEVELEGEEAGQYFRNKRPKRIRLAGKYW